MSIPSGLFTVPVLGIHCKPSASGHKDDKKVKVKRSLWIDDGENKLCNHFPESVMICIWLAINLPFVINEYIYRLPFYLHFLKR